MKKPFLFLFLTSIFLIQQVAYAELTEREELLLRRVKEGKVETMSEFMEIVVLIEKDNEYPSKTLLHHAASLRLYRIAKQLIKKGADVNAIDYIDKTTPLFDASSTEIADLFYKCGAQLDVTDEYEDSLLHGEPACYLAEMTEWFIAHGVDVNNVNRMKQTPLHMARRKKVVELLIAHGANVNAADEYGSTPLDEAVLQGYADIVDLLISNGAKIQPEDDYIHTPFHIAAANGHQDVIEILIKNGADPNCVNLNDETPLHFAAKNNNREMVDFLIKKGSNPELEDMLGKKPQDYLKGPSDKVLK